MNSGTSTKSAAGNGTDGASRPGLAPWQFFVIAGLGCSTAALMMARGQSATSLVLMALMILSAVTVGVGALRTLAPLVSPDEDRTPMVGHRTRLALEREKALVLRSIKELEFDRAMGKLAESDFVEMSSRLRARATGLMRQLDSGAGYREEIEKDLARRLAEKGMPQSGECTCGTKNDHDARFCKSCGRAL